GPGPLGAGGIGPSIGPLLDQRPVEPLGPAVGPGPVGPDEAGPGADAGQGLRKGPALGIGPGVVGGHPLHGDAGRGEEGRGPAQEPRAGGGLLVGADLAVGRAGVAVNGRVDTVEADPAPALGAGGPAPGPPPAPRRGCGRVS